MFRINSKREKAICKEYLPTILPKGVVGIITEYVDSAQDMIMRTHGGIIEKFFKVSLCRGCGNESTYETRFIAIKPYNDQRETTICEYDSSESTRRETTICEYEVTLLCVWCLWFPDVHKYWPNGKIVVDTTNPIKLCSTKEFHSETIVPADIASVMMLSDLVGFHLYLWRFSECRESYFDLNIDVYRYNRNDLKIKKF